MTTISAPFKALANPSSGGKYPVTTLLVLIWLKSAATPGELTISKRASSSTRGLDLSNNDKGCPIPPKTHHIRTPLHTHRLRHGEMGFTGSIIHVSQLPYRNRDRRVGGDLRSENDCFDHLQIALRAGLGWIEGEERQ
jgi:hypothetical protein